MSFCKLASPLAKLLRLETEAQKISRAKPIQARDIIDRWNKKHHKEKVNEVDVIRAVDWLIDSGFPVKGNIKAGYWYDVSEIINTE